MFTTIIFSIVIIIVNIISLIISIIDSIIYFCDDPVCPDPRLGSR